MRIPGVPYVQGRNDYADSDGRKYGIAIHNTSNDATAEGEASYATRRTDGISAHLYVDRDSIVQSLDTGDRAGHAGSSNGNNHAVAVEITGVNGWTRQQWLDRVAWSKLGAALAHVVRKYGIAVRRASVAEMKSNPRVKAFYGHDDMRRAWGGTTHTDPGPNFPWDRLFQAVNAALGTKREDDDVSKQDVLDADRQVTEWESTGVKANAEAWGWSDKSGRVVAEMTLERAEMNQRTLARLEANLARFMGRDFTDEQAIIDGVLTGLGTKDLDDVATALKAAFGDRTAELAAKLAG